MVIALVRPAITVIQQLYKHRKTIYAVLTAQDRYISKSFRYGGYGKATSYGVRSGALIGSVAGAFISNAEDTPGNGVPKVIQKQPPPSKPYQTRGGPTVRSRSRSSQFYSTSRYGRCPRPRKYRWSCHWFNHQRNISQSWSQRYFVWSLVKRIHVCCSQPWKYSHVTKSECRRSIRRKTLCYSSRDGYVTTSHKFKS